jgi:asparagine synthase (glutamine-hydrolysing)
VLSPDFLARAGGYDPIDALRARLPATTSSGELLLHVYAKIYLPTLLCQEDKTSMAHSLESRIPICDNELIDFACRLSFRQKLHGGRLKAVPRDAAKGMLPDALFTMPKRGFPTPFARWFRAEPGYEFIRELLLSDRSRARGIFNPAQIEKWLDTNRGSRFDTLADYARANRIYSAALIEQWHRIFVDGEMPIHARRAPLTAPQAR